MELKVGLIAHAFTPLQISWRIWANDAPAIVPLIDSRMFHVEQQSGYAIRSSYQFDHKGKLSMEEGEVNSIFDAMKIAVTQ